MMQAARNRQRSDRADCLRASRVRARPHSMRDGWCRRVAYPDFITLLRDCDNICRHGGTDRLGKTKLEKADGTGPAILRTLKIGAKGRRREFNDPKYRRAAKTLGSPPCLGFRI